MDEKLLDELTVVKRSGQRVAFNAPKIAIAIKHAFDSVEKSYDEININKVYEDTLSYIIKNYEGRKTINVEDIQDIIENQLSIDKYEDVYLSFSKYRQNRKASREAFVIKQQHKFVKSLEHLNNYKIKEDEIPIDTLNYFGKTISKEYAKAYLVDSKYLRAHEEGSIYIHNINSFLLGIPERCHVICKDLDYILLNNKEVDKEISIPKIDYVLEPFLIDSFKKTYINLLFRYLKLLGFEEYINFNKLVQIIDKQNRIDLNISIFDNYIYNSRVKEVFIQTYEDTIVDIKEDLYQKLRNTLLKLKGNYTFSLGTNMTFEGNFINEIYLKVLEENELDISTIFKVKDKNILLEEVCKLIVLGKDIQISYIDTSYNKGDVEYFKNSKRILENVNTDKEVSIGRMVLNTTSINLSKIALNSKTKKDFYSSLDNVLELAKNELILDFEYKGDKYKENFSYLFNDNILDDEKLEINQKIRKVIKNGTLNIGIVGLKEAVYSLCQEYDSKEIIKILKHIRDKSDLFINETKLNFVISETNEIKVLEELIKIDKSIYGLVKKVTDKDTYESINTIKLDLETESKIHKLLNGGYETIIKLPKNVTYKNVLKKILEINDYDVGFVKFKLEKKCNSGN